MVNYIKRNKGLFILAVLFICLSTLIGTFLQFIKGDILDYAIIGNGKKAFYLSVLLFILILCESIFAYLYDQFGAKLTSCCTWQLKSDLFHSILQQSYVNFANQTQGSALAKWNNEADMVKDMYFSNFAEFIYLLARVVFVSSALFLLNWKIAIVTIFLLSMPLYIPKLLSKKFQQTQKEYTKELELQLTKVTNWLSAFELIKNYSVEQKIEKQYFNLTRNSAKKLLHVKYLSNANRLLCMLMSYISYFIILMISAWFVVKGNFSAGDFFVAIGMIDQLSYPLGALANYIACFKTIKPVSEELLNYMHNMKKNNTSTKSETKPLSFYKEINFKDVTFSYTKDKPLINNFTYTIQKGGKYLIKGPSGCGKSSLLNLLLRYYNPNSGDITVDGTSIKNWEHLYSLISVVRQDAVLLNDTLRNNLTLFESIDDSTLIDMLKNLGLEKYANTKSLDMNIKEDGSNLSGGERKRISLARALLKNTPILLLDEPLANLDNETAFAIEDLLLGITNRTLLIVSHQFSEEKTNKFQHVMNLGM